MSKTGPCSSEAWREKLSQLGFLRKGIVEAIVCTYNGLKRPNAAPMGITTNNLIDLIIQPFTQTSTYKNLLSARCCTINITLDPFVYYNTVFKDGLPPDWFSKAEYVEAPRLKECDAWIEAKVKRVVQRGVRAKFLCGVVNITEIPIKPRAYSRAAFAIIESIIHTTRIQPFLSEGKVDEARELLSMIRHYSKVVRRVAPRSAYSRLMDDIMRRAGRPFKQIR